MKTKGLDITRLVMSILAILGLSLPLLIAYICDIVEVNKKKKSNS